MYFNIEINFDAYIYIFLKIDNYFDSSTGIDKMKQDMYTFYSSLALTTPLVTLEAILQRTSSSSSTDHKKSPFTRSATQIQVSNKGSTREIGQLFRP